jgi:hypothetical protein
VLFVGAALRLPPRSAVALSVTADVIQSLGEVRGVQPRLLSIGLALGAATVQH